MQSSYFERWEATQLPVVSIKDGPLNMFASHDVEMLAIAGCAYPYGTFKFFGIKGLLRYAFEKGAFQAGDDLIEATSGESGLVLSYLAQATPYHVRSVILVMKQDVPAAKRGAPVIPGAYVIAPDVVTSESGEIIMLTPIQTARKRGGGGWSGGWEKDGNLFNLDQYACPGMSLLYRDLVASLIRSAANQIDVLVLPVGTGATLVGLSAGFRACEDTKIVATLCADQHEIPGMRDEAGMAEIGHPWQSAYDYLIKVERKPSFLCVPWISRLTGIPAGPSGGATFVSACRFVQDRIADGTLERFRKAGAGKIRVAFLIHDTNIPYVADRFVTEFSLDDFRPSVARLPISLIFGP